jgi:hypothetical protein
MHPAQLEIPVLLSFSAVQGRLPNDGTGSGIFPENCNYRMILQYALLRTRTGRLAISLSDHLCE